MRNERYELEVESDALVFAFTSIGTKGEIPKLVMYQETNVKDVYNLAFGDKNINTGDLNDEVITNNNDSQKVLATVAATVYAFMYKYPNAWVAATGSTKARTRLYQMGISNNLKEITADFDVLGRKEGIWHQFEKNIAYDAFLIRRKKNRKWKI